MVSLFGIAAITCDVKRFMCTESGALMSFRFTRLVSNSKHQNSKENDKMGSNGINMIGLFLNCPVFVRRPLQRNCQNLYKLSRDFINHSKKCSGIDKLSQIIVIDSIQADPINAAVFHNTTRQQSYNSSTYLQNTMIHTILHINFEKQTSSRDTPPSRTANL